jgi:hypothetical protein
MAITRRREAFNSTGRAQYWKTVGLSREIAGLAKDQGWNAVASGSLFILGVSAARISPCSWRRIRSVTFRRV